MIEGKLVRDRVPDIVRTRGRKPAVRTLSDHEFRDALLTKLDEEVAEVHAATPDSLSEELADVLEVAMAIADVAGVDWSTVEALRREKRSTRGGFEARLWMAFDSQK